MYIVMGIHPMSKWVIDWYGNIEDAVKCRDRLAASGRVDITYKIYSLLDVDL